jgi:hypothetical protein
MCWGVTSRRFLLRRPLYWLIAWAVLTLDEYKEYRAYEREHPGTMVGDWQILTDR